MIAQAAQTSSRAHAAERYIMPNMRLCAYSFDDDSRFGVIPGLVLPGRAASIPASDPLPVTSWPKDACVLLYGADATELGMLERFSRLLSHIEFSLEFDKQEFEELCEWDGYNLALECDLCIPPDYRSTLQEEVDVIYLLLAAGAVSLHEHEKTA